jgi:GH25 family lysozyme M1 (1,4-beta-N-acetylmuramidase)
MRVSNIFVLLLFVFVGPASQCAFAQGTQSVKSGRGTSKQLPHAGDLSGVAVDLDSHTAKIEVSAETMKNAQIELVIHRLTIGRYAGKDVENSHDILYPKRFEELQKAAQTSPGLKFGAYHVLFPSPSGKNNGEQQAYGFLKAISDLCPSSQRLLLAVDWEDVSCNKEGVSRSCGIPDPSYLKSFVKYVTKQTGKKLLVYTFANVLSTYSASLKADPELLELAKEQPLWFAQPRRDFVSTADKRQRRGFFFPQPIDFTPWNDWTLWQFNAAEDKSKVRPTQAISMTVGGQPADFNWFNGGRNQFSEFFDDLAIDCKSINPNALPKPDRSE